MPRSRGNSRPSALPPGDVVVTALSNLASIGGGLVFLAAVASAEAMPREVVGRWATKDGRSHVEIEACGNLSRCGRIVWLKEPNDDQGRPKRDIFNVDREKRDHGIVGLELLRDFVADDEDGRWTGGTIYNPEDGQIYRATIRRDGEDRLIVRGYVAIPLFGVSRIWRRVPELEVEADE